MSIYSNVTEQDTINLRKLAEQQKSQRALKIKNRILKQTHDGKLAESLSPITKNLDTINETTKQLGETFKKSDVEDGNTQTTAIENLTITQSLRDTLAFMKKSNNFFSNQNKKKKDSKVFRNNVLAKPVRENIFRINDVEYDIIPDIQAYFTNTKVTTKLLDDFEKETVFDILTNVGFYDNQPKVGLKAARMQDALYVRPKVIAKNRNPP